MARQEKGLYEMKRIPIIAVLIVMFIADITVAVEEHVDGTVSDIGNVTGIGWNGEYWLISGGRLVTYDGESFKEIEGPWTSDDFDSESSEISFYHETITDPEDFDYFFSTVFSNVWVLGWFDGHWLLTGGEWIAKFDGETIVAENQYCIDATMTCGDDYCLIIGDNKPGNAAYPLLYKYDGTEFTNLYGQMEDAGVAAMVLAVSKGDGGNWLIVSYESHWNEDYTSTITTMDLVRYDGTTFEKVMDMPETFYARAMDYNGEYWLMTDSQQLLKYEDGELTDLTEGIDVTWGTYAWSNEVIWADGYWMISMGGHLLTYDGDTFTEIASGIGDIGYNGEYWLIEGDSTLLRYDGDTFTDLTDEYLGARQFPHSALLSRYVMAGLAMLVAVAFIVVWNIRGKDRSPRSAGRKN